MKSQRVLVAEDDTEIALEIAAVLSSAGHRVVGPATTFHDDFRIAARESLDTAVLDPDLDGPAAGPVAPSPAQPFRSERLIALVRQINRSRSRFVPTFHRKDRTRHA